MPSPCQRQNTLRATKRAGRNTEIINSNHSNEGGRHGTPRQTRSTTISDTFQIFCRPFPTIGGAREGPPIPLDALKLGLGPTICPHVFASLSPLRTAIGWSRTGKFPSSMSHCWRGVPWGGAIGRRTSQRLKLSDLAGGSYCGVASTLPWTPSFGVPDSFCILSSRNQINANG